MNIIGAIVGKKNSGKSYFLKSKIIPCFSRVIIFDTQNEYQPPADIESYIQNKFFYVDSDLNLCKLLLGKNTLLYPKKEFYIVCQYLKREEIFESLAWLSTTGYFTICIEEFHLISSKQKDTITEIAFTSRHRNINLFVTSQRITSIDTDFRSQTDFMVTFCQDEPLDIERCKRDYGIENVENLTQGNYMILKGKDYLDEILLDI